MKQFVKSLVVGVGVMGMVVACEPGDGSETSNSNTDNTGSTGNVTDNTDSTGSAGGWYVLEMEDDPNNSTLAPCDKGNIKSPGADIDGAVLNDGNDDVAELTNCSLTNVTSCTNDNGDASKAQGGPDSSGSEETGTYVSLNGGRLRCEWTGQTEMVNGHEVSVFEVGGTGTTNVEQYRVRFCKNTDGNCTQDSTFASGDNTFTVDGIL